MLGDWTEFDPSPELPVLCHAGIPVMGIPKDLKEFIAVKNYKDFMCKKFAWSNATWHSIDWKVFKAALKKQPGHSVSLWKYLHA